MSDGPFTAAVMLNKPSANATTALNATITPKT
jgi:hypothetical protein